MFGSTTTAKSEGPDAKRQRKNEEEDEVSAAAAVSPLRSASDNDVTVTLSEPDLKPIPKLIMKLYSEEVEQVAADLEKLGDLVDTKHKKSKENTDISMKLGAYTVVLLTMRKWQYNAQIQKWGCFYLTRLLSTTNDEASIVAMGGVEAILDAMTIFPDDEDINRFALNALMCAFCSEQVFHDSAGRFVKQLDGVAKIVKCMKRNSTWDELQETACALFTNLARGKEIHKALLEGGAASAVAMAAEKNKGNKPIKEHALEFMKLVFSDDDNEE